MTVPVQICVIAHNEEAHILGCLQGIRAALENAQDVISEVHIINNGSTDATQSIAEQYVSSMENWFAHEVLKGDKANAWNLGLYEFALNDVLTIYIDGDCKITPDTVNAFVQACKEKPEAYIYAGIPKTKGRTTEDTIRKTLAGNALSGNLFALSPRFVSRVRELNFKLPVGLIGDDSLLAWVSTHDFKLSNGRLDGLLVGVASAEFFYHRLSPTSISNIRLYIRRLQRYSLRHLQQCCIRQFLEKYDEFALLPNKATQLYDYLSPKFIRKDSVITRYFDSRAFKEANLKKHRELPNGR